MNLVDQMSLIVEFLGSATVFGHAVAQMMEEKLWHQVTDTRLTASQLKLLKLVSLSGDTTIGDVALFLEISNAAASKAVDKLVGQSLLRRSEGARDRRAIHLSLTGQGRGLLDQYDAAAQTRLTEIFGQFSREELNRTMDLLDALSTLFVDHRSRRGEVCVQCGIFFRRKCTIRQHLGQRCLYLRPREQGAREVVSNGRATGADNP